MAIQLTSLNTLIDSLCHSRRLGEAVRLAFSRALEPHQYSVYSKILQLCTELKSIKYGKLIHSRIITNGFPLNTCLSTRLMIFYCKFGEMGSARKLFDRLSERSVVTWTALVSGYSQNADCEEALRIFSAMRAEGMKANQFTYASALSACTRLSSLKQGMQIQGCVQKGRFMDNLFVQSALIDLHSKCGNMEDACSVFRSMEARDLVSWNAMIGGYAAQGLRDNAILVFGRMLREGMLPDSFSFGSLLKDIAGNEGLAKVNIFHGYICQFGFGSHKFLNGSLIDAYVNCRSMDSAIKVYNTMQNKDLVSCTALIKGYACEGTDGTAALQLFSEVQRNMAIDGYGKHGYGHEAIALHEKMEDEGLKPNDVTFLSLLFACGHNGLTREGLQWFSNMISTHEILPRAEHYSCLVDLLARAGQLDEAYDLAYKVPADGDASAMGAVLGACSTHDNMNLGQIVATHLFNLEPENPSTYVVLSGIYAAAGLWKNARETRMLMKKITTWKYPGYSLCQSTSQKGAFSLRD